MNEEQRLLQKVGFLLQYPSEEWYESLGEFEKTLNEEKEEALRTVLEDFISYIRELGLKEYEEQYVRQFDFSKNTNLYLSTHDCTDPGKQAEELVQYKSFFLENGYDTDKEMPDFLPALLELASAVSVDEMKRILSFSLGKLKLLRSRFIEAKLPYAFLLDIVLTVANRLEVA